MTARNGSADWLGDVQTGSGTITVGDGVFRRPYSYDSRCGEHHGTNPEQLIAAAQAGCFTMALASKLASGGHPPDLLRTNATVHLRMHDGSITLARLEIETEGRVKGIDEQQLTVVTPNSAESLAADVAFIGADLTKVPLGQQIVFGSQGELAWQRADGTPPSAATRFLASGAGLAISRLAAMQAPASRSAATTSTSATAELAAKTIPSASATQTKPPPLLPAFLGPRLRAQQLL